MYFFAIFADPFLIYLGISIRKLNHFPVFFFNGDNNLLIFGYVPRLLSGVQELPDHFFDRACFRPYHFFFFYFSLFCCAYSLSVKLFNRIIKSATFNTCFVNAIINNARGSYQGVKTKQSHDVPNTAIIIMSPVWFNSLSLKDYYQ